MTPRRSLTLRAKRIAKRYLPLDLRRRGRPLKRRVEEGAAAGDRARRRSFMVPHNDIAGAIKLNIAGRESQGVLQPDEVDAYVEHLRTELLALRNVDTGEAVVDRVVRVADEESGDAIDRMPDLFVLWNRSKPIDRVQSEAVGVVEYMNRGNRTGDHTPESCVFAIGPGVVPGQIDDMTIYDLMPSVAAALGVETAGTDGKVVTQLVSDESEIRV
jgi:predicted AlkP superfamily phosphohydrolase/phosphomutase